MNHSRIAVRYAKALFLTSLEKDLLDDVLKDILLVENTVKENPEIISVLKSPVIKPSKKKEVFNSLFASHILEVSLNFFYLIIDNSREIFIRDICRNFNVLYRKEKNIINVELTTAVELNEATIEKVKKLLVEINHADIIMENIVDKDLIGGFVLTMDDKSLDSSVSSSLKQIEKELTANYYQKKL